jgi:hypothetical protein
MAREQTSLGRIFKIHGILDWDEMFPQAICRKCPKIGCEQNCAAVTIIGAIGVYASNDLRDGQIFPNQLRRALKSMSDHPDKK